MKDTYFSAKLVQKDLIRLALFSSISFDKIEPSLSIDDGDPKKLVLARKSSLGSTTVLDFRLEKPLELGHSYRLDIPQLGQVPLDVTEATTFPNFDEEFYYDGDDLGFVYSKKFTRFALWAPLASNVELYYRKDKNAPWSIQKMERSDRGVYRACLSGNYETYLYKYRITNNEVAVFATDPYAKASAPNGEASVVIDFAKTKVDLRKNCLPYLESQTCAIVYEGHVRDLTIEDYTDIEKKGTFLGLIEKGRKTKNGLPAGFDYLTSLNITHLQLLPIYDYKTVDERDPSTKYNWGYDPAQYFVPEGSYASNVEDPYSRIIDCKKMVAAFHEKGIRIVMDVVYNHVYEFASSVFEKVVPSYYFRHRHNGQIASTSGCGDDFASERKMVRKLIVDCCAYWIDTFGIDGFRFDLMGINDVETLNQISDMAKAKDPCFFLHGEGWNMGGEVSVPLGHMGNYEKLPTFGFFNDFYRETMKKYLCEDYSAHQAAKFSMSSSSLDFICPKKFLSAIQSTNYVECHDNGTFYDLLAVRRKDLDEKTRLQIVNLANATVLLSFGVPFIHAGQEIGLTKFGEDNTYNKGDKYNQFSYRLLEEREWMYRYFCHMAEYRKKARYLHIYDPRVIDTCIEIHDYYKAIRVSFMEKNLIAPKRTIHFFLNPSSETYTYHCPLPVCIDYDENGKVAEKKEVTELLLPPRSFLVVSNDL